MGQARQRGSYEERKEKSIERKIAEEQRAAEVEKRRPECKTWHNGRKPLSIMRIMAMSRMMQYKGRGDTVN